MHFGIIFHIILDLRFAFRKLLGAQGAWNKVVDYFASGAIDLRIAKPFAAIFTATKVNLPDIGTFVSLIDIALPASVLRQPIGNFVDTQRPVDHILIGIGRGGRRHFDLVGGCTGDDGQKDCIALCPGNDVPTDYEERKVSN